MSQRWQYPSHVEGLIPVGPEQVSVDRWRSMIAEPVRVASSRRHLYPTIAKHPATPAPALPVFAWQRQAELPARDLRRRQDLFPLLTQDPLALTLPERSTADKWYRPIIDPVRRLDARPSPYPASWRDTTTPSPVLPVFGWHQVAAEPIRRLRDQGWLYPTAQRDTTIPLPVLEWHRPVVELARSSSERRHLYLTSWRDITTPAPPLSVFGWNRQPEERRQVQEARYSYPWTSQDVRALAQAERITPDKWWQPASEPVRKVTRAQYASEWSWERLLVAVVLPEMAWHPAIAEPVRDARRWQRLWLWTPAQDAAQLTLPEVSTLDKWWRPPNEPIREVARRQFLHPASWKSTSILFVDGTAKLVLSDRAATLLVVSDRTQAELALDDREAASLALEDKPQ